MLSRELDALPEFSDKEYVRWQTILEERTGISFFQHKSILQKGLSLRMRETGITDYDQYFRQVSAVPDGLVEWMQLVDRVSVKETSFFRDAGSFAVVRDFLLDRIGKTPAATNSDLDIWSVGCATGEEAYSLAMTAVDIVDYLAAPCFVGVTATDISSTALAVAKKGCYSQQRLNELLPATKNKYFVRQGNGDFEITANLRQRMCFVQNNILDLDVVPGIEMDVIYCQNVLIYFRRELQAEVLNTLTKCLKPGGLLVVGPGDAMGWKHPLMNRSSDLKIQAYTRRANNS